MYRNGRIYDEIAKEVIRVYLDYDIKGFPIDEKEVCKKLGVKLFPYSTVAEDMQSLLFKRSEFGFFSPGNSGNSPVIFFNDTLRTDGAIRFTIFHEVKHYVFDDEEDDENDDLADYFARYFMCPIPYLLLKEVGSPQEIESVYGTSFEAACYVYDNLVNRKRRYGYKLFNYEIELIEHLEPELLEKYVEKKGAD